MSEVEFSAVPESPLAEVGPNRSLVTIGRAGYNSSGGLNVWPMRRRLTCVLPGGELDSTGQFEV